MSGASKAAKQAKSIDAICSQGNIIRKQLWKTQECKFFLKGKCTRGAGCSFAHGDVKVAPDFRKTSLCEAFTNGNKCRLSAAECPFAHGVKDLRITSFFLKDDKEGFPQPSGGNFPLPSSQESDMLNFLNIGEIPAFPPAPELWNDMQYHKQPYAAEIPWMASAPPPPPPVQRVRAAPTPEPEPRENIIRNQLWRTQECKFFLKGKCSRGAACTFAHGEVKVAPDFTKTSLCEAFCNGNKCRLSSAECPFAHGVKELRMTPLFMKSDDEEDPESTGEDSNELAYLESAPSDSDSVALKYCGNAPSPSFPTQPESLTTVQSDEAAEALHSQKMQLQFDRLASAVLPTPQADSLPLPVTLLTKEDSDGQAAKLVEERKAALAQRLAQLQAEAEKTMAEMEGLSQLQAGSEEKPAESELTQEVDVNAESDIAAISWLSKATAELHCVETPSEVVEAPSEVCQ